ncbi:polysaccharide deacetylase family protein [Butyrivibrio sp. MC2021]|uniref:polysaccharide deacetylase family protein n=1 Tax=Butyrivibrio sp. MC2021 TaxID=1408306 RepID=UPI00047AECCD|nr:polysaccharide deacetylase family protein [Butyrivibrio sp. MC2021]
MASASGGSKKKEYSSRIKKLRRLIIIVVVLSCLIPTFICLVLSVRFDRLRTEYEQVSADLEWYRNRYGSEMDILSSDASQNISVTPETVFSEPEAVVAETREPTSSAEDFEEDIAVVDMSGAQNPEDIEGTRYVYLTFDDGPSSSTDEILDILAQYDVKATFFVVGKPDSRYTDVYKRIVDEGHTLGMHSYSHKYSSLYESLDSFRADLDKLRVFLYETTGVWSRYYRFPGGSSNSVSKADMAELATYLEGQEVTFFDWNISAGDDKSGANKDTIYNNIVNNVPRFKHCIVLMHDSADKKSTVEALPEIIEAIQAMDDTVIVPITNDTLPVQHIKY